MRARAMEGGVSLAWGERNHGEEAATVRDPSRSTERASTSSFLPPAAYFIG